MRSYSADAEVGTFSQIPSSNLNGGDHLLYDALLKAYECTPEEVQVMPLVENDERKCGDYLDERGDKNENPTIMCAARDCEPDYTYLCGREHARCCFVDGESVVEKTHRGHFAGNDAGEPVYSYHKSYIRVPASRLKKWVKSVEGGGGKNETGAGAEIK